LRYQIAAYFDARMVEGGPEPSDAFVRETLSRYMLDYRPRAVALFDRAARWGVIAGMYRVNLERPTLPSVDEISEILRTIGRRLDQQHQ
jgi:hypothetical protein